MKGEEEKDLFRGKTEREFTTTKGPMTEESKSLM